MRIAAKLFASCALVSVSAAAATAPTAPVANCKATSAEEAKKGINNCDVTVIVPAGCGSGIQVAPDPIVVQGDNTVITWTIRSSGKWTFGANGIQMHDPGAFATTGLKGNDKVFTGTRQTSAKGVIKYDINLVGPDGKCQHDPTVINQ